MWEVTCPGLLWIFWWDLKLLVKGRAAVVLTNGLAVELKNLDFGVVRNGLGLCGLINGLVVELSNGLEVELTNGLEVEEINGLDVELIDGLGDELINGLGEELINGLDVGVIMNGLDVVV